VQGFPRVFLLRGESVRKGIVNGKIPRKRSFRVGAAPEPRRLLNRGPVRKRESSSAAPEPRLRRAFQRRLLSWYRRHRRDLPWRKTTDPYHILVSEIMLQQTQVDRVVPKYHEFLSRYPTFEALAGARVREVKRAWYPLGYNIRPVRLHSIACETVERYGGRLPDEPEQLLQFKGIGRYTAGAVATFAYGKAAPILDTNVARVLHRIFLKKGEAKTQRTRLWALSEALIPKKAAYDFNQGLMDFGAMVCTAKRPRCPACPMKKLCKSYPLTRVTTAPRRRGRRRNGQANG
jgi:A/G-specific adenine glycosylase